MLLCLLALSRTLTAQEMPSLAQAGGVAERAFSYRAMPIQLTVRRGHERLPIHKLPELKVGDQILLKVDLDAPELNSFNAEERGRLRDWSIGWFLATPEGSLVFDSTSRGKTDRGRIDLQRGESEIIITVEHERQKFPIFFFVRTRTLESWEEIRQCRESKASNFVDHFGRYSDVVNDYQSLQTFLTSLQRESPQAETLDERLIAGFRQLGFTVDSRTRLGDPEVVAKLLGELETGLSKQSSTFKAEAAGKLLSQVIGNSDLGLIGAAVSIGSFFHRATDYSESYHWSPARLQPDKSHYWVMSAERIRYGENEQAPDGTYRPNVRSILVCTPLPTKAGARPTIAWENDGQASLQPGDEEMRAKPEIRIHGDKLKTRTHPGLLDRGISPHTTVWDSVHGDRSPIVAGVDRDGSLTLVGLGGLWVKGDLSADIRVRGQWGFDELNLAELTVLRSGAELTAHGAPYLLSQSQRYRLILSSATPVAIGHARFAGREVPLERDGERRYLVLDPSRVAQGETGLEVYAGQGPEPANLLLSKDFFVASGSNYHVIWPRGSDRCELVCQDPELRPILNKIRQARLAGAAFQREGDSTIFRTAEAPKAAMARVAELIFADPGMGVVPGVHLEIIEPPRRAELQIYSLKGPSGEAYRIDLDTPSSHLLASRTRTEFRLRGSSAWPEGTRLTVELLGPGEQAARQTFSTRPNQGEECLRLKGEILFGDFVPKSAGALRCQLSVPVKGGSNLPLEWTLETDWKIVDLPVIQEVTVQEGTLSLQGEDLDITVSRIFRCQDDPIGAELTRKSDGSYRVQLPELDPDDFWLELRDAPGQRFRVRSSKKGGTSSLFSDRHRETFAFGRFAQPLARNSSTAALKSSGVSSMQEWAVPGRMRSRACGMAAASSRQ